MTSMQTSRAVVPDQAREQQALLAAIRADHALDDRLRALVGSGLDWALLRRMALRHGVMPLLYTRLRAVAGDLVPPADMEEWRTIYHRHAEANAFLTLELIRVVRLLQAAGVVVVPFKGPVLAEAAYGDVAMRQFCDLDILVSMQDVMRAHDVLAGRGYVPKDSFSANQRHAHLKRTAEFTFSGRDGTTSYTIDLHFRLTALYLGRAFDTERAFARRQTGRLSGYAINTLAPADLLLYTCLHGTRHLWTQLSNICDVGHIVAAFPQWDWASVLHAAGSMGVRRILLLGMTLARDIAGATLPAELERVASGDEALAELCDQVKADVFRWSADVPTFVEISRFHLKAMERARDRLSYCLVRALAPTVEDWRIVDVPDRFYALYYLIRPLRLLAMGLVWPMIRRARVRS